MGFRTVVILNNDCSSEWNNDPKLGQRIENDQSSYRRDYNQGLGQCGEVVECVHTSQTTLGLISHLRMVDLLDSRDINQMTEGAKEEAIVHLNAAAKKLGYHLVKNRTKKD